MRVHSHRQANVCMCFGVCIYMMSACQHFGARPTFSEYCICTAEVAAAINSFAEKWQLQLPHVTKQLRTVVATAAMY